MLKRALTLGKHLINGRIYYVTLASLRPCVWADGELKARKTK